MKVDPHLLAELQLWYAREARLLDERRFEDWLELCTPDVRYRIPTRYALAQEKPGELSSWNVERELASEDQLSLVDESFELLQGRVARLQTGMAWAETPPSFTRRLVGNVEPLSGDGSGELRVVSAILLFKSRLYERVLLSAQRRDRLVRVEDALKLRERTVVLDDTVLESSNLSTLL